METVMYFVHQEICSDIISQALIRHCLLMKISRSHSIRQFMYTEVQNLRMEPELKAM